jgi:integrase
MLKSLIPFLVDTGLRLNEAMSLNWGNVNLTEGSVFIERGKSKNARRTVPLTPRARKIVETLHEKRSEERVFPVSSFYVSHQFRGLRDDMELPDDCVLHSCRHTFCTRLGTAGVSAFQIMRLAGHSSVAISQRYVHGQEGLELLISNPLNLSDGVLQSLLIFQDHCPLEACGVLRQKATGACAPAGGYWGTNFRGTRIEMVGR